MGGDSLKNEKWQNAWDRLILFVLIFFPVHYLSSLSSEFVLIFFIAIIAIKEVVSFIGVASRFADNFSEDVIRRGCIPKDVKKGEIICFQEAKGEAKKKVEEFRQQKVVK